MRLIDRKILYIFKFLLFFIIFSNFDFKKEKKELINLFIKKEWKMVIDKSEKIKKKNSNSVVIATCDSLISRSYYNLGNYDKALKAFQSYEQDIFPNPFSQECHQYIADLFILQDKNLRAIERYIEMIKTDSTYLSAYYKIGILSLVERDTVKAKDSFEKVVEKSTSDNDSLKILSEYNLFKIAISDSNFNAIKKYLDALCPAGEKYLDSSKIVEIYLWNARLLSWQRIAPKLEYKHLERAETFCTNKDTIFLITNRKKITEDRITKRDVAENYYASGNEAFSKNNYELALSEYLAAENFDNAVPGLSQKIDTTQKKINYYKLLSDGRDELRRDPNNARKLFEKAFEFVTCENEENELQVLIEQCIKKITIKEIVSALINTGDTKIRSKEISDKLDALAAYIQSNNLDEKNPNKSKKVNDTRLQIACAFIYLNQLVSAKSYLSQIDKGSPSYSSAQNTLKGIAEIENLSKFLKIELDDVNIQELENKIENIYNKYPLCKILLNNYIYLIADYYFHKICLSCSYYYFILINNIDSNYRDVMIKLKLLNDIQNKIDSLENDIQNLSSELNYSKIFSEWNKLKLYVFKALNEKNRDKEIYEIDEKILYFRKNNSKSIFNKFLLNTIKINCNCKKIINQR